MIDLLTDKTGVLAVLVNIATPQPGFLCCGLAYFAGGLRGIIEVSNGEKSYQIKIPEPVAFVATPLTFSHSQDLYQIELHENPSTKTEKAINSSNRE